MRRNESAGKLLSGSYGWCHVIVVYAKNSKCTGVKMRGHTPCPFLRFVFSCYALRVTMVQLVTCFVNDY